MAFLLIDNVVNAAEDLKPIRMPSRSIDLDVFLERHQCPVTEHKRIKHNQTVRDTSAEYGEKLVKLSDVIEILGSYISPEVLRGSKYQSPVSHQNRSLSTDSTEVACSIDGSE